MVHMYYLLVSEYHFRRNYIYYTHTKNKANMVHILGNLGEDMGIFYITFVSLSVGLKLFENLKILVSQYYQPLKKNESIQIIHK